jgi:hypothetical protein
MSDSLALRGNRLPVPLRKTVRELAERVDGVQADAVVAATRVEMGAFVTHLAMHHVGMATETEARLTQRTPLGAARYQHLADAFTALAANEIDGLNAKWRSER